jgi:hypothetical protein
MTEVEISQLFAKLSTTAAILNRRSDEINRIIEGFEEKLRALNVGIEVWCGSVQSYEEDVATGEEDRDGNPVIERRSFDVELGYCRFGDTWHLMVRDAVYRKDTTWDQSWDLVRTQKAERLLDASRKIRIASLAMFPGLLKTLNEEAEKAVAAITAAQNLVVNPTK